MKTQVILSMAGLALVGPAFAQTAPDAGQVLRQQQTIPEPPTAKKGIEIEIPEAKVVLPGGQKAMLNAVSFAGHSVFSDAELLRAIGPVQGQAYDLGGLYELAARISHFYHLAGYPFARTIIPPQDLSDGNLRLEIIEGRYGKIYTSGDARIAESAAGFLYPLESGEVIETRQLERTTLIIDDLPGVKVAPLMRPGQGFGTGDLEVTVTPTAPISGEVGLDNHGNRFTGAYRIRGAVQWDSPLMVGDQIMVRGIYTNLDMTMGSLNYALPLGKTGLRGNMGYSHTYYQLGEEFGRLGATGTADVTSAGLTYPLIRSQQANITLTATYQFKMLKDQQDLGSTNYRKSSNSLPLGFNFDYRDSLGAGGVTYGSMTYTSGNLHLNDVLKTQDIASGRDRRGRFGKVNLDIARLQQTPINALSFYLRASAQWADKNLDSSEGFLLGGPNGVRAYPVSEGAGDEGWLGQLEMRYAVGEFVPYLFYDAGKVRINAKTGSLTTPIATNTRSIAGGGVGVRYQHAALSLDASVAWRSIGGEPQSDNKANNPAAWLTLVYRF